MDALPHKAVGGRGEVQCIAPVKFEKDQLNFSSLP